MERQAQSRRYAYWVVGVLIGGIALCIGLDIPVFYGIACACLVAALFALRLGHAPKAVLSMACGRIKNVWGITLMLLLIGGTIGLWMATGVIGTFVYYGLKYLSGLNMVLVAFFMCSALACVLGTAMGTLSTIGIAFVSIAQALQIPMPLMAGAVVSGCYLADRTAPLSAVYHLVSTMTGTDMPGNLKYMSKYTLVGVGATSLLYFWLGAPYAGKAAADVNQLLGVLENSFAVGPLLMLPLVLMVVLVLVFRRSVVQSLLITLVLTLVLAFTVADLGVGQAASSFALGFHPQDAELARLVSGSGVLSMVSVILSVLFSAVLNGLMDGTQMITLLLDRVNKPAKNEGHLMCNAAVTSILLTLVTCNQPICAMATGAYFSPKFDEMHITRRSLCHLISDNGIIVSPLIPWNVNAMMAVSVTGVAALRFLPFSFLCIILPLLSWFNIWRASTTRGQVGLGLLGRFSVKNLLRGFRHGKSQ